VGTLFTGLMSGTSLDGVDAVVLDFDEGGLALVGSLHTPYPPALRAALLEVVARGEARLETLGQLDVQLADIYAAACHGVWQACGLRAEDIAAVGCHGQTLWHAPHGPHPFTWQLGDAHRLAELTGVTVVADFRRRDVAAGGQGAPLVPAFHADVFRSEDEHRLLLNLGGIANITWLPNAGEVLGFDTGPANGLLDAWCQEVRGEPYDANGAWAASGTVLPALLEKLLAEPWLAQPPPRSTGRELFNLRWLRRLAGDLLATASPADVQATLAEYTAATVADALRFLPAAPQRVLVCGGGSFNEHLLQRLTARIAAITAPSGKAAHGHEPAPPVESTADHGLDPMQVEAAAFAWLAWRTLNGLPGNLPAVTGARGERVLGCVIPA
jgi:anhydro-N-acetylmuramic acid kinase